MWDDRRADQNRTWGSCADDAEGWSPHADPKCPTNACNVQVPGCRYPKNPLETPTSDSDWSSKCPDGYCQGECSEGGSYLPNPGAAYGGPAELCVPAAFKPTPEQHLMCLWPGDEGVTHTFCPSGCNEGCTSGGDGSACEKGWPSCCDREGRNKLYADIFLPVRPGWDAKCGQSREAENRRAVLQL